MKLKKLFAGIAAGALAVSSMAVSAFAADGEYEAFAMVADTTWCWGDSENGNWNTVSEGGFGTDATITGDGTYTVSVSSEQTGSTIPAYTFVVFNVDINGLATAMNAGKDAEGYADLKTATEKMEFAKAAGLTIKDVSIAVDGETVYTFKDEDLLYGDIEGNGKIRIELYNTCGESADANADNYNAPEDWATIAESLEYDEIAVTFTVEGLDKDAPAEPETPDEPAEPETPAEPEAPAENTGLAGVALAGLALAGASVVASKKRK